MGYWARILKFCLAFHALILFFATVDATLDPIIIKGSHFFYKTNGSEFFIRGVSYTQDNSISTGGNTGLQFVDVLSDTSGCLRDIPYLMKLRTNVVRVYGVEAAQDHSGCMAALDAAGIYVLLDLSSPSISISQTDPRWSLELYTSYTSAIDAMANYTNVLGFLAGSEVANNITNSGAAAFVKASIRDMKAYIKAKGYRQVSIGTAIVDAAGVRSNTESYFNCGDSASSVDFLGMDSYAWCGDDSSFTISGYSDLVSSLANYSVPVFLSEYGCNSPGGAAARNFTEVQTIYSSQMTDVFSGGIVFEYFEDENDFGLVKITGNAVSTLSDFDAYSTQLASVSPASTAANAYTPTNTATRSCPITASTWLASETLPPTPNSVFCDCMYSSLSCLTTSDISANGAQEIIENVCGQHPTACLGVSANATTGTYGAYSVCNTTQQVSWVMNQYYLSKSPAQQPSSCVFQGLGSIRTPATLDTQCNNLLAQANSVGTGTVTSLPAITRISTSSSATPTSSSSSGGSGPSGGGVDKTSSSTGGLTTGAKAGVAIGAVAAAAVLAVVGFCLWRRKRKTKDGPLSGEGGLEVGDAPPEFTALRRAEMDAIEAEKQRFISGELAGDAPAVHEIDNNELVATERQELDNTETLRYEELYSAEDEPRRNDSDAASRGELSGKSTRRSELSPKRKPLTGSVVPGPNPFLSHTRAPASSSNTPWSDPGVEEFGRPAPVKQMSAAEIAEAAEMRRIDEEERAIDEAIAESERLQALRMQKGELQKRKLEMMAKAGEGGGSSSGPPSLPHI